MLASGQCSLWTFFNSNNLRHAHSQPQLCSSWCPSQPGGCPQLCRKAQEVALISSPLHLDSWAKTAGLQHQAGLSTRTRILAQTHTKQVSPAKALTAIPLKTQNSVGRFSACYRSERNLRPGYKYLKQQSLYQDPRHHATKTASPEPPLTGW